MTTAQPPDLLRLRTPEDVLAAVPYLLGFHPTDSLVVLGLRGKRLVFHARGDLLDSPAAAAALRTIAEHYGDVFAGRGVNGVVLVGYGEPARVTPLIQAVKRSMRRRRIEVREMLRVHDGRFWSYLCRNPLCCPPEGTRFDTSGSAVAAAATMAGFVALPDRDAVVRSLSPPVALALVAIRQATDRAEARLLALLRRDDGAQACVTAGEAALAEADRRYTGDGRLDDDELAWLSLLIQVTEIRDLAWRRIDRDGREGWDGHGRLWTDVVRRCDPVLAAPPAMLLSYVMWRSGDGLRAAVAVERALAADPVYSAARLMAEVLDRAVPPTALDPDGSARRPPSKRRRRAARRRRR